MLPPFSSLLVLLREKLRAQIGGYGNAGIDVSTFISRRRRDAKEPGRENKRLPLRPISFTALRTEMLYARENILHIRTSVLVQQC